MSQVSRVNTLLVSWKGTASVFLFLLIQKRSKSGGRRHEPHPRPQKDTSQISMLQILKQAMDNRTMYILYSMLVESFLIENEGISNQLSSFAPVSCEVRCNSRSHRFLPCYSSFGPQSTPKGNCLSLVKARFHKPGSCS